MNKERHKIYLLNSEPYDNEDVPVLEFLDTKIRGNFVKLLEVGSGICRFADKLKLNYSNIEVTCLDINTNLIEIAKNKGYKTINKTILRNNVPSCDYDIVHCSHVIEHLAYPEISIAIDELLRITKSGGYCIIRSPLMSDLFFDDIDHVRPYPPEAILNYLSNQQQQKKGKSMVRVDSVWYRTTPKKIKFVDKSSFLYLLMYMHIPVNQFISLLNKHLERLWKKYRFPSAKANGYVLILQKIQ